MLFMFDILSLLIMLYIISFISFYISWKMIDLLIYLNEKDPIKAKKIIFLFIFFIFVILIILFKINK